MGLFNRGDRFSDRDWVEEDWELRKHKAHHKHDCGRLGPKKSDGKGASGPSCDTANDHRRGRRS
ncbi:hypothetical protein [Streptomyces sp. WZ-12]|uniref:hypothetical protein n=1 Tax=Streptomyces sp. WZ-12 TaxID=3030210 RepID=UPI002380E813|nr:hypothetical protein [Streptomyces sp. WZ-12]